MTSQIYLDSYIDAGVITAIALANQLTPPDIADPKAVIAGILAFDPPSGAMLRPRDVPGFIALAHRLREMFVRLEDEDVDAAAEQLNSMLAAHPAHPYLAKEDGVWRLHHHPADAPLVPMYTSICAEGMARMIGGGYAERFGICDATHCDRVFFDNSKNGTRRFCSVTCQNRVKTAAFRLRQARGRPKRR
ncbi:MAG TPA: CGNR zinc finger domain-containing protein [Candidatus Synoicihabitans sp.]|nr:CGNR zinc finger domain-containing protein [Candidatus Synoicihabitans sp.]